MAGGASLVVQWLRLHVPNAEGPGSIPGQGTRSQMPQLRAGMPQLKIPCAASQRPHMAQLTIEDPMCCNYEPEQPDKSINSFKNSGWQRKLWAPCIPVSPATFLVASPQPRHFTLWAPVPWQESGDLNTDYSTCTPCSEPRHMPDPLRDLGSINSFPPLPKAEVQGEYPRTGSHVGFDLCRVE